MAWLPARLERGRELLLSLEPLMSKLRQGAGRGMDRSDHGTKKGASKAFVQLQSARPASQGPCPSWWDLPALGVRAGSRRGGLRGHCLGSSPTSAAALHGAVNKPFHLLEPQFLSCQRGIPRVGVRRGQRREHPTPVGLPSRPGRWLPVSPLGLRGGWPASSLSGRLCIPER